MRLNKLELAIGVICFIVGCVAWYITDGLLKSASAVAVTICGIGFVWIAVRG